MEDRGSGQEGRLVLSERAVGSSSNPTAPRGRETVALEWELEVQSLGRVVPKSSGDIWRDKVDTQDCHHPSSCCGPTWGVGQGWVQIDGGCLRGDGNSWI